MTYTYTSNTNYYTMGLNCFALPISYYILCYSIVY